MYYYLSFLRPPPQRTPLGSSITITPQIANDLRTELIATPTEIYLSWSCLSGPNAGSTTHPSLLSVYEPPLSTYKTCTVPLPPGARAGDTWRIGLSASASEAGPGGKMPLGGEVLGVWSEGIEVVPPQKGEGKNKGKAKDAGGKQTRITREWALPSRSGEQEKGTDILRIVEQTSFDLDKKIWDSGLALSSWLHERLSAASDAPDGIATEAPGNEAISRLCAPGGARIVEIGAGTGLVAIALAAALARREGHARYSILTTDLYSAIPLIEENIALNEQLWSSPADSSGEKRDDGDEDEQTADHLERTQPVISLRPLVLDWDQPVPDGIWRHERVGADGEVESVDTEIDVVIAADVTYNTASFPSLIATLERLLTPRSATPARTPLLLLAYKQRDPAERELWTLVEGWMALERIDTIEGHEGPESEGAVELWVGRRRS